MNRIKEITTNMLKHGFILAKSNSIAYDFHKSGYMITIYTDDGNTYEVYNDKKNNVHVGTVEEDFVPPLALAFAMYMSARIDMEVSSKVNPFEDFYDTFY